MYGWKMNIKKKCLLVALALNIRPSIYDDFKREAVGDEEEAQDSSAFTASSGRFERFF